MVTGFNYIVWGLQSNNKNHQTIVGLLIGAFPSKTAALLGWIRMAAAGDLGGDWEMKLHLSLLTYSSSLTMASGH
jgi:hypothetical protein